MAKRICLQAVSAGLITIFMVTVAADGQGQDAKTGKSKLQPRATADLIESVLKSLELTVKKDSDKKGVESYSFQRGETKIRLVNYGGEDLWIEAIFDKKVTLEQANAWNTQAKFSRCVLLENDGKTTASLEMQLDCIRGVSEGMVRQFLIRFGGELKDFQKFVAK